MDAHASSPVAGSAAYRDLVDDVDEGLEGQDLLTKNAYYNKASENSISHVEAKMIYKRHILEASEQDLESPIKRVRTTSFPNASTESYYEVPHMLQTQAKGVLPRGTSDEQTNSGKHLSSQCTSILHTFSDCRSNEDHGQVSNDFHGEPGVEALATHSATHPLDISPELHTIASNVQNVLNLRRKFIRLSLQSSQDNPRDSPTWKIYPPPPDPTWDENKGRPDGHSTKVGEGVDASDLQSQTAKKRKPGHNVGEDFDLQDFEPCPGIDQDVNYDLDQGSVFQIYNNSKNEDELPLIDVPDLRTFYKAMDDIQNASSDGPTKSFAYRQLDILEGKFQLYFLVNSYQETAECKKVPHRDFYNVRKVDTHVHHSACMNQKHLLRFIKSKMKKSPNEVVMFRDGRELSLHEVFNSIQLNAYDLSIDTLDMHAHTDSFHRFDKFNLKYNPVGESRLREIFLKTDNYIKGRYLAELTKEVISDLEASKYQFVEWRISIYGRSRTEWDKLAAWVIDNKLISHNVRWLVQIPRLYSMYKATEQVQNFEDIMLNVFEPIYRVTKDPSSNPKLHIFLQRVVGFDSVDDESKIETRLYRKFPPPKEWNTKQNPPYTYWIYHLFANMTSLNHWRQKRGFNTFVLRPHCGEAGDIDHLAAAVLCCHSISHGLMLRKVPVLQYIFYLDQIGIAMSPLSNNALFLSYDRNPFPKYLRRGLNVSLSTDDPLQFAFTKEPLIEEYSVAAQIYRLSAVDMCELAYHSVIQSGFEYELKKRWLGPGYRLPGVQGHNVGKVNVPDIRAKFRLDTLTEELDMLERFVTAFAPIKRPDLEQRMTPGDNATAGLPLQQSEEPSATSVCTGPKPRKSDPVAANGLVDLDTGSAGLKRTQSLILPPRTRKQSLYGASYSPISSAPRIFPGLVHARHRKTSARQGSGSETGGGGTERSETSKEAESWSLGEGISSGVVLEETAEEP